MSNSNNNKNSKKDMIYQMLLSKKIKKYSPMKSVFMKTGYRPITKIGTTLQGSVYTAVNMDGDVCVLKRASVVLHELGLAYSKKKFYRVNENIVKEAEVLKYLTEMNPGKGLTKYVDFFCDGTNYFLLMENGGESLLNHVKMYHKKMNENKIDVKIWKDHVKILFKEMCLFIDWLHNIARIAHLDISLENILIKDCVFKNGEFISHGVISFIDFGVSKSYINKNSFDGCTKFVGKKSYQAPEIYHKKAFNAAKADVWSLGVILFMILFFGCPYNAPTNADPMFNNICGGFIAEWAKDNSKTEFLSKEVLDLFCNIFCNENKRMYIHDIVNHRYIN